MNILLKHGWLRDICCGICLDHVRIVIACSDKSSKFNSFACTLVVSDEVLDFHVFGGKNFSLMNEGNIYIFYYIVFCVFNSIREIRKNKNLAKMSTYTVC